MKKVSMVVAVAENWVIGKKGGLPWKLPADMKHFKDLTTGHTVIMGKKTYDSIGKPLPNRTNIVVARDSSLDISGCIAVRSIGEALEAAPDDQEIFVIGGAEIYNSFLSLTQKIYLTQIHHEFDGDTFFPKLNLAEWSEKKRQNFKADDKNPYNYSFIILERISG
jgi:dihydrofolate reductase